VAWWMVRWHGAWWQSWRRGGVIVVAVEEGQV